MTDDGSVDMVMEEPLSSGDMASNWLEWEMSGLMTAESNHSDGSAGRLGTRLGVGGGDHTSFRLRGRSELRRDGRMTNG